MTFTDQQLYHIYNCITAVDHDFMKRLARVAVETALDIQTDMFLEADPDSPAPDDNDIRTQAHNFAGDTLGEFKEKLLAEIKAVQFNANIKLHRSLKTNLKFID